MLKRGGERDVERAAAWFVRWWREEGCALSANAPFLASSSSMATGNSGENQSVEGVADVMSIPSSPTSFLPRTLSGGAFETRRGGWGFDFQWELSEADIAGVRASGEGTQKLVQREMERVIDTFVERVEKEEKDGGDISTTQRKKREKEERQVKRERRIKEMLARRRSGKS